MKWLTILMIAICMNILMFIYYFYYPDVTKNLDYEESTRYFYDYHYIMDSSEPNA